jgi:malate dehydrogenase (oxaloacetate-decarboxylating)
MFMAASFALADCSPLTIGKGKDLLPELGEIRDVSLKIAFASGSQAIDEGVAFRITPDELRKAIRLNFWYPEYRKYRRVSL